MRQKRECVYASHTFAVEYNIKWELTLTPQAIEHWISEVQSLIYPFPLDSNSNRNRNRRGIDTQTEKNVISSVQMIKFGLFRFDSNKCELFEKQLHPDWETNSIYKIIADAACRKMHVIELWYRSNSIFLWLLVSKSFKIVLQLP